MSGKVGSHHHANPACCFLFPLRVFYSEQHPTEGSVFREEFLARKNFFAKKLLTQNNLSSSEKWGFELMDFHKKVRKNIVCLRSDKVLNLRLSLKVAWSLMYQCSTKQRKVRSGYRIHRQYLLQTKISTRFFGFLPIAPSPVLAASPNITILISA